MKTIRVAIPLKTGEQVSGVVSEPDGFEAGKTPGIVFAHGAANDMDNPLIVFLSQALCETGYLTLRFNFLYKEKGKASPDSQATLVGTWQSVCRFLKVDKRFQTHDIIAAGKSMGGRVASQMAAEGILPARCLVFLGYPLHAPGKRNRLRDDHFHRIKLPMLFIAGTRDPFADLALLKIVLGRLNSPWELEIIDGGDHSLTLPKTAETTQRKVYERISEKMISWLGP